MINQALCGYKRNKQFISRSVSHEWFYWINGDWKLVALSIRNHLNLIVHTYYYCFEEYPVAQFYEHIRRRPKGIPMTYAMAPVELTYSWENIGIRLFQQ